MMLQNTRVLVAPVSDGDNPFLQNIEIRLAGYFHHAEGQFVVVSYTHLSASIS